MAAVEAEVVLRHGPSPEREGSGRRSEGVSVAVVVVALAWSWSPLGLLQVLGELMSAL